MDSEKGPSIIAAQPEVKPAGTRLPWVLTERGSCGGEALAYF
jgi:hypothetical protein